MKVFIGSSTEAKREMREVASWLEAEGHEALPWDKPGVFVPGEYLKRAYFGPREVRVLHRPVLKS
jgi:hypothetical protein